MNPRPKSITVSGLATLLALGAIASEPPPPPADWVVDSLPDAQTASPYAAWTNGPSADSAFFPIAVWLQSPANAARYKAAGINVFVGLWDGPTEAQLEALKAAGMQVVCAQNDVALKHREDKIIIGWMHGDEPDNAQTFKDCWGGDVARLQEAWPEIEEFRSLGPDKPYCGYGPPIPPRWIVRDYEAIRAKDPTRPVLLNLGQGVAWEKYVGRGERTGRLEDYPAYLKGCDIASFDIYPATHDDRVVQGNLWYVAQGVTRLRRWSGDKQPVWNCIECTRISNPDVKPTPAQVRSEVWMSIIHGSRGLIYFAHQFKPTFVEAGLLADAEMLAAVTAINRQVRELAPVLNSPTVAEAATVRSTNPRVPVHFIVKRYGGVSYLLAVSMHHEKTAASFDLKGVTNVTAEVLGEARRVALTDGVLRDGFTGFAAHLYRIPSLP